MPVWLSLFVAIFGTLGFFATLYAIIIGAVEAKRAKGKPKFTIASGSRAGVFTVAVNWDVDTFALQIYRFRISLFNPNGQPQESVFSVTHDPVLKAPFSQEIEFPPVFAKVLKEQATDKRAIVTFDFRTVEENTQAVNYSLAKVRKIYNRLGPTPPKMANQLKVGVEDAPAVMSLDYSELVERRKYLRELESAAKAKAAKAAAVPAKPAAAPKPAVSADVPPAEKPTTVPAAPAAAPAPVAAKSAPNPAPAAPTPVSTPGPVPVVAAPAPTPVAPPTPTPTAAPSPVAAKPAPAPEVAPKKEEPLKPAASPRPETKLEAASKGAVIPKPEVSGGKELPSIRSVIAQANAQAKARPGEETAAATPKEDDKTNKEG